MKLQIDPSYIACLHDIRDEQIKKHVIAVMTRRPLSCRGIKNGVCTVKRSDIIKNAADDTSPVVLGHIRDRFPKSLEISENHCRVL